MYLKKWILNENKEVILEIENFSPILRLVLKNRGLITKKDVDNFVNANFDFKDPFCLKDMEKAVDRIKLAIENDEKIIIYGDYDVDGMTSTVVLLLYLSKLGADVNFYIPSRETEGYGLNVKAIDKLSEKCSLIITVDNGITAIEEVRYANMLGIDVIITDHHKPLSELPNAVAVLNPHREDCESGCKNLAGVGVVFKLISALEGNYENIIKEYSDIICLGTIADVMPIVDENRSIVKAGFEKIKKNPNIGIKALLDVAKVNITNLSILDVSYKLAPRLNSASRLNNIKISVDLLLCNDCVKAEEIAKKIDETNNERKKIENDMMDEITQMVMQNPELVALDVIVIAKEGWNHSIAGINASKLVNTYSKPCILISIDGETANGSGRSIEGFPLVDAIDWCKDDLVKYGGHTLAAGFVIETKNIESFTKKINNYIKNNKKSMPVKCYNVDGELFSEDITVKNIRDLELLEPYGVGNDIPLMMIKQAKIYNIKPLVNGKYTKVYAKFKDSSRLEFIAFNIQFDNFLYKIGDEVDFIVNLRLSEYNNVISPTLIIQDVRLSSFDQDEYFASVEIYNKFKNLEDVDLNIIKNSMPTKKEMAVVYRYLKNMINNYTYTNLPNLIEYLFIKLSDYKLNYIKIGICLDIFEESGIISLTSKVEIIDLKEKVDIHNSKTYKIITG